MGKNATSLDSWLSQQEHRCSLAVIMRVRHQVGMAGVAPEDLEPDRQVSEREEDLAKSARELDTLKEEIQRAETLLIDVQ